MFAVRPRRPEDEGALAALYRSVYSRSITDHEFRWKHRDEPGHSGFVAEDAGTVVAHYGGWVREWRVGPHQGRAVVALDAMTAQSHRGQGVFGALVRAAHEKWRTSGVALILGLPNSPSVARAQDLVPVARLRMTRMQAHFTLPPRLVGARLASSFGRKGPIRWVRRLSGRLAAAGLSIDPVPIDQLPLALQRTSSGLNRDPEWLRWRYQDHPLSPYRAFGVRADDGAWLAWSVVRFVGRDPGVGQVAELHGSVRAKFPLLATLLGQAPPETQRVEAFVPEDERPLARASGFWIRRQDAPVHAAILSPEATPFLERANLQWGDFDLV